MRDAVWSVLLCQIFGYFRSGSMTCLEHIADVRSDESQPQIQLCLELPTAAAMKCCCNQLSAHSHLLASRDHNGNVAAVWVTTCTQCCMDGSNSSDCSILIFIANYRV